MPDHRSRFCAKKAPSFLTRGTPAALLACACVLLGSAHASASQARANVDTIAERVVPCTTCHGKEGRATREGYFPRIAGKPAGYLYNQLLNFRDGRRHYALMTYLVDHLTDAYLYEIATYFAGLDLPYPPPPSAGPGQTLLLRGESLVRRGDPGRDVPACSDCHGDTLTGSLPNVPGLLGMSRDYLHGQLGHWRTGTRRAHAPDCMAKIAAKLTPDDISAVAAWLSAQPVPEDSRPRRAARVPVMECGSALR
jgi:cytochrome c553